MTEQEDILYQLETLAGFDAVDIEYDDFEVWYEDTNGIEAPIDVSVVDLARRAAQLIKELEETLTKVKSASKVAAGIHFGSEYKHRKGKIVTPLNLVNIKINGEWVPGVHYLCSGGKYVRTMEDFNNSCTLVDNGGEV